MEQNAYKKLQKYLLWKRFKVAIPQLSKEEHVFVVEKYFERQSYIAVQETFRQRFKHALPCKKTIQQNVKKYRLHGTTLNRKKENSGIRMTACSKENIERVRNMLENNPRNISARRNGMALSAPTFNRITHEELRWYPYRVKVRQHLKENDFQCRSDFSYWFLQQCNNPCFF